MQKDVSLAIGSVADQLDELRRSEIFLRSGRLFALLEFLVTETLGGRGDTLKELVIGHALYSRSGPYDPGIDSSVRVEARRLRRKLEEYYASDGRNAVVRISLPQGGYRPVFTFTSIEDNHLSEPPGLPHDGLIDLAIMPFHTLTDREDFGHVADGLVDEIIFALEHDTSIRIAPRLLVFQFKCRPYSLAEAMQATHARVFLCGTLRMIGPAVRVTVELSTPIGFTLWSAQFDCPRGESFALQEGLAKRIVDRIPMHLLRWRPN